MSRLTVSARLRQNLARLLEKRGTATRLSEYSGISKQYLTYFMHDAPNRTPIELDDLDEIANFFRVDIGSLLGCTRESELNSDEQRLLYAFRVLARHQQDALLTVIDQMQASSSTIPLRGRHPITDNATPPNLLKVPHVQRHRAVSSSGDAADRTPSLAEIRAALSAITHELSDIASALPDDAEDRSAGSGGLSDDGAGFG